MTKKDKRETIFIYLVARNKKGVRVLCRVGKGKCLPTRLSDLNQLGIELNKVEEIQKLIDGGKMKWEPWIESADSFVALRTKLSKLGYSSLPMTDKMEVMTPTRSVSEVTIKRLPNQVTMLRKGGKLPH